MSDNFREIGNKVFFEKEDGNLIQPTKNKNWIWLILLIIVGVGFAAFALIGEFVLNTQTIIFLGIIGIAINVGTFLSLKKLFTKANSSKWLLDAGSKTIKLGDNTISFSEITEIQVNEQRSRNFDAPAKKTYEIVLILNNRKMTLSQTESIVQANNTKLFLEQIVFANQN